MVLTLIITLLGLLSAALFYLVWYFTQLVIAPKTFTREYAMAYDLEKRKFDEKQWLDLNKEEFSLQSCHGYELSGIFVKQDDTVKPKGVAILCHGITWNLVGSIKYLNLFYDLGLSVILYDHRNHGMSGGKYTGFGAFEVDDLNQVIHFAKSKLGEDTWIVTHGESMGAAVVLQQLATAQKVDACIADCGFSDLETLLAYRLKESYPWLKLPVISLVRPFIRLKGKYDIRSISPIKASRESETPVFWIHGEADDYIPHEMSEAMYASKSGAKKLLIVPEARHAGAYITHPKAYKTAINDFLEPILEARNESSN